MSEAARLEHSLPHRLRLRFAARRGDAGFFDGLRISLAELPGMRKVSANARTGSVVLEFTGERDDMLDRLRTQDIEILENAQAQTDGAPVAALSLVSGRDIDPMFVAGAGMALVAVVQAFRGQIFGPALSAGWHAIEAFRLSSCKPRDEQFVSSESRRST